MWKELSSDPDGMVFWGCLFAGLVFVAVSVVFGY